MLSIGIILCMMACVNLLLKNFHIVTLIQIVFGIPYVIIGIRNIKGKKNLQILGCRLISCRFAGCSYETTCRQNPSGISGLLPVFPLKRSVYFLSLICRIASSGVSPTFSSNMIQSAEQSVSG